MNDNDVIDRVIKSHQNHPSVLKIKHKFGSDLNSFDFQQIKAPEVKKLLKEIDIKKAVGADKIPRKLIKIGADIIAEPLTQAISCFSQKMLKLLLSFLSRKKNLINMTF